MRRIGIVILGASIYDNHELLGNIRFANSAREFKKVCGDARFISEATPKVLNLFEKSISPSDVTKRIADFLRTEFEYILIYYCGHGDIPRKKGGGYRVFLRGSKKELRSTLLNVSDLIGDLTKLFINRKVFVVLDACYSGEAIEEVSEFMDAGSIGAMAEARLFEDLPQTGIAILAATYGTDVALAKNEDKLTLFTGALVDCVKNGIEDLSDRKTLSWLDIKDQIAKATYDRLGADAPIPRISTRDERHGDITRMPFFINRAYSPTDRIADISQVSTLVDDRTSEHLYWARIPADADIEVFDDFLTRFPSGIFAPVAQAQIRDRVKRMTRLELEHFVCDSSRSYGAPLAQARLAQPDQEESERKTPLPDPGGPIAKAPEGGAPDVAGNSETRAEQKPQQANIVELTAAAPDADTPPIRDDRRFIRTLVKSPAGILILLAFAAVLAGLVYLVIDRGEGDRYRSELAATNNDVGKLQALIARCQASRTCPILAEARAKLAQAEGEQQAAEFRNDFQAVGNDVPKLTIFVERCQASPNCPVLADARARLAQAKAQADAQTERARQAAQFRSDFQAAGNDVAKLTAFVDRCQVSPNCPVLAEARTQLAQAKAQADAQTERARQAAQFRSDFQAAGNDVAKLTAFVDRCQVLPNCPILAEARAQLAQAKAQADAQTERARQAAQFRNDFQAAANDVAKLTAFVDRCQVSPNCPVLAEARTQLAQAKAQAAREQQILENSFSRYGNWDLDLGTHPLVDTIRPSASVAACEASCQANSSCKGYSFDKWNSICYLKPDFVTFSADPRTDSGVRKSVKAPYQSGRPKAFCTYPNSALEGTTIRTTPRIADWQACKGSCADETNCAAYTLSPDNSCRLLSNTTDRYSGRPGYYSGIKSQNPDCTK